MNFWGIVKNAGTPASRPGFIPSPCPGRSLNSESHTQAHDGKLTSQKNPGAGLADLIQQFRSSSSSFNASTYPQRCGSLRMDSHAESSRVCLKCAAYANSRSRTLQAIEDALTCMLQILRFDLPPLVTRHCNISTVPILKRGIYLI